MKLLITLIIGFLIPFTIGIFIYLKDFRVIMLIAPIACAVAFILNTLGIVLGYFSPTVDNINPYLITGITNVGLFSLEPCILIFAVRHSKIKPIYLLLLITIFSLLIDLALLSTNFLIYENGWNIIYSFIMFLISFLIVYLYYLLLKKLNIFEN